MKVYHPTIHAAEILRDGFGERSGTYLTPTDYSGVWVFDRPVDRSIGGGPDAEMLVLEIPDSVVEPFETGGSLPYRQFLVPAALLNLYGPARLEE
jgi:hypothetical protein